MTREEVLELIREHLADELELDPARIDESTHFRNDLDADSLDLYTLVQELEDTYGVKMSDEQAARIQTVGAAVDFVLSADPPTLAAPRHRGSPPDADRPRSKGVHPEDARPIDPGGAHGAEASASLGGTTLAHPPSATAGGAVDREPGS